MAEHSYLTPTQFEDSMYANAAAACTKEMGISVGGVHYVIPRNLVLEYESSQRKQPIPLESYPIQIVDDLDEFQRVLEMRRLDERMSASWLLLARQLGLVLPPEFLSEVQ